MGERGFSGCELLGSLCAGNLPVHERSDAGSVGDGPLPFDLPRYHVQAVPASFVLGCCCKCGYLGVGGFHAGNTAQAMVPLEPGSTLKRLRWLAIVTRIMRAAEIPAALIP